MSAPAGTSIVSIVIDALRTCGQQRDDLFWLALPNVVAMSLLQAAALTVNDALGIRIADLAPAPGVEPPDNIGLFLLVLLALIAASAYFLVTFSVAWLRRILTPLETPTIGETLRWRPRHTRFLLHWIGFLLSASMLLLIIGAPLAAAGPLLAAISRWDSCGSTDDFRSSSPPLLWIGPSTCPRAGKQPNAAGTLCSASSWARRSPYCCPRWR